MADAGAFQVLIVAGPTQSEHLFFQLALLKEPACRPFRACTCAAAIAAFKTKNYDVILLDHHMPGGNELLRRIRELQITRDIPVLITGGRSGERAIIAGLASGADDYVPKSCSVELFHARLFAALRRNRSTASSRFISGAGFLLDVANRSLNIDGRTIRLQPKESRILQTLLSRPNITHSSKNLGKEAWGRETVPHNTLITRISAIRRKLGDRASCIETIRGSGYCIWLADE